MLRWCTWRRRGRVPAVEATLSGGRKVVRNAEGVENHSPWYFRSQVRSPGVWRG